jgi:catechol 2,3-dioxygenase
MVELQVDNFGNWEASAEWMRTSEDFRRDPIGSVFDPDAVWQLMRAGHLSNSCKATPGRENILPRNSPTLISRP